MIENTEVNIEFLKGRLRSLKDTYLELTKASGDQESIEAGDTFNEIVRVARQIAPNEIWSKILDSKTPKEERAKEMLEVVAKILEN